MSGVLAVFVALCALLAPSWAHAQGRLDARVPARALVEVESSAGARVGSCEFLQRDPEGFADSVNVYAAMANDPINNRDPTGRIVYVDRLNEHERRALIRDLNAIAGVDVVVECVGVFCSHERLRIRASSLSGVGYSRTAQKYLEDVFERPEVVSIVGLKYFVPEPIEYRGVKLPVKGHAVRFAEADLGSNTVYFDLADFAAVRGPARRSWTPGLA